jgi:hypothetical protein
MKLVPAAAGSPALDAEGGDAPEVAARPVPLFTARQVDGGIEEDLKPGPDGTGEDRDFKEMFGELNARGIAGSASRLPADMRRIRGGVNRSTTYSLVVVDEVFLDHAHAARTRMTRELVGRLSDVIKAPVVSADDLHLLVNTSRSDTVRMAALAAVVVGIVAVVFSRQREILEFFSPTTAVAKVLAACVLVIVVPLFAVVYGTLTTSLLKRFHLE